MEDRLLHTISDAMCSSMLSLKLFVYSTSHSENRERRDQRIRQVVAYDGTSLTVRPNQVVAVACRKWSFTRGPNCNALAGEILVFRIGGSS